MNGGMQEKHAKIKHQVIFLCCLLKQRLSPPPHSHPHPSTYLCRELSAVELSELG